MNKTILMGRVTKDIELRFSQSANPLAIAKFSIAVNRKFKREGEPDADFINCVAFGKTAENIAKFFSKGRMIAIIGHIQCGSYEKEGRRIYTTDIIVDEWDFTGEKKQDQPRESKQGQPNNDEFFTDEDLDDEDLPF